jgi:phage terminase large subunit GpA-like protein
MISTIRGVAARSFRRAGAPKSRLTGSEWANIHGWIARSSGAGEPGRYSTDRAPYLTDVLDVMCDETHRDVVFNKPGQCGFTEALNQHVGYVMAEDPSGIIVIRPSIDDAKSWMKERIDPMLAESPRLRGIVRSERGRRVSDDTLSRKVFPGGWLVAVGANSPTGLRSRPARRVIGDERSGWTLDARQEGDPWDLGCERTATFWNAKRIQGSTPGEEEVCPVTAALRASDWREFHVACPSCGFREPFQWKSHDGTYRLVCEKDPADQLIPQTARYLCTACGVLIPETEKARMLRDGRWVARHPDRPIAGFDVNGLVSPWRTWADVADLWVKAQRNPERLKVFFTHVLASPWRPRADRIHANVLSARVESVAALPAAIGACFGAVDVQKDRLETLVLGVGAGEETWILEWAAAEGDPEKAETWQVAWEQLTAKRDVPLWAIAVDTGFLTDTVWRVIDLWNSKRVARVLGTKGEDGRGRPWIQKPGPSTSRRVRRPWLIGVDTAKDAIALRLQMPVPPGGPGAFHFADTLDPAFYDQLTSEEQRIILLKGRQTRAWRPVSRDRANEGLDLTIMALGAMYHFGPAWVGQLGVFAKRRHANADKLPASNPTPSAPDGELVTREATHSPLRQRSSAFVHRWRNR